MTLAALPLVGAVYRGGDTIGERDGQTEHLRGRRLLVVGFLSLRDLGVARPDRVRDTDAKLAQGKSLAEINAGRTVDAVTYDPDAIRCVEVRVTIRGRLETECIDLDEWSGVLLAAPADAMLAANNRTEPS